MESQESDTRECPFCKEVVKQAAVRCKHCLSSIPPEAAGHGGVCPFCKENINPEAVRCPHCAADLVTRGPRAGGRRVPVVGPRARKVVDREASQRSVLFREDNCEGCADTDTDEDGTWSLIECSEHYCIYELTTPNPYGVFT